MALASNEQMALGVDVCVEFVGWAQMTNTIETQGASESVLSPPPLMGGWCFSDKQAKLPRALSAPRWWFWKRERGDGRENRPLNMKKACFLCHPLVGGGVCF